MTGVQINLSGSGDALGSDGNANAKVNLPKTLAQAGFAGLAVIEDNGAAAGRIKRIGGNEQGGLRAAQAEILWDDTFNATAQNTSKYDFMATTQTGSQAGGFLILNTAAVTTINTNSGLKTFRAFPLYGRSDTRISMGVMLTQVPQANNLIEFGLFAAVLSTRVAPTDGVFFRYNASAELRGVVNFNGVETQTAAIAAPSASAVHDYCIVIAQTVVLFFIDGVLVGTVALSTDAPAQGQAVYATAVPFTVRTYHGGSAPALATQVKVATVTISLLGPNTNRQWSETKALMGSSAYQAENGGVMGQTGNNGNNANPTAQVPTNTTAALGSGFGGLFQETLTLAAGTDGIIQSYQNPVGGPNQTPRNLVIRGVTISGVVSVALTTNPLVGSLALCFGHTNVSLATAEAASFTAGGITKAPRRVTIGTTSVASSTAAPGTPVVGVPATLRFESPIVVQPGEFVAIAHKKIGTAPATGAILWSIAFDAYWE